MSWNNCYWDLESWIYLERWMMAQASEALTHSDYPHDATGTSDINFAELKN